jgi:hypothetical protein
LEKKSTFSIMVLWGLLGGLWVELLDSGHQNMQTKATERRKGYLGAWKRELYLFLASPIELPRSGVGVVRSMSLWDTVVI